MSQKRNPIYQLLKKDRRYTIEAYKFVREALSYAQDIMKLGKSSDTEPAEEMGEEAPPAKEETHLTGQQLCEAIRVYALEQYGLMAQTVLKNWGITCTGDFGEIVYNLIDIGFMKRSENDRREDFDDVYDFDKAFHDDFAIKVPD